MYLAASEGFLEWLNYTEPKNMKNRVECLETEFEHCLHRVCVLGEASMITEAVNFKHISSGFKRSNKRKRLHCSLNEAIFTTESVMYLTKGHPLLERFDQVFMRVIEAGLYSKYLAELTYVHMKISPYQNGQNDNDTLYLIFSLGHLKIVFIILLCGQLLSTLVFMCELLYSRIVRHNGIVSIYVRSMSLQSGRSSEIRAKISS